MKKDITIPANLYRDLWLTVDEKRTSAEENIKSINSLLAACVDYPSDIAAANNLRRLKAEMTRRYDAEQLLEELEKYDPDKRGGQNEDD